MVCKKCGQQFEDSFNNCPGCGEGVNGKQKDKKPIFKKWWFWLIIAILAIAIIGGASGGSSEEGTATGNNEQTTTSNVDVEETTVKQNDNAYYVGDVLDDNGLEITYVSAEKWTGYDQYFAPESGNIIIKLCFNVKNNASGDRYITSYDFNCYADGSAAEEYYYTDDSISLTLSQGRSGDGAVYFEVPADAEKIEVEYEVNYWNDKKAVFVVELSDN